MNNLSSYKHVSPWKRIVVFRQGQFGDTLVAFPVIDALHQLYPHIPLVYCTNHFRSNGYVQGNEVARLNPHIEEIITYEVEDSVAQKFMELKKGLQITKHDLLLYLPYSTVQRYQVLRDWIFFKALNFKQMLCFKETWDWTYVYQRKDSVLPRESERMLGFLGSAGIPLDPSGSCSLNYDQAWAKQKWDEWGLNGRGALAVCPGSKMQSKRWPMKRYIEVGREWYERSGMALILIGGAEEASLANEIIDNWPGYGFSACGASLSQTASVLSSVMAYCGNDTGSMHLAAILGIPCVAIFSSRAPAKLWYPVGNRHIVLRKDVGCKHCNLENCYTTPPACLDKISVGDVLDALTRVCRNE